MKLGIGTYAYTWSIGFSGAEPAKPITAFDLLAKARELGVRVVQSGRSNSRSGLAALRPSTCGDRSLLAGV